MGERGTYRTVQLSGDPLNTLPRTMALYLSVNQRAQVSLKLLRLSHARQGLYKVLHPFSDLSLPAFLESKCLCNSHEPIGDPSILPKVVSFALFSQLITLSTFDLAAILVSQTRLHFRPLRQHT